MPNVIPKLAVPLELEGSSFRTVEQDSIEEIAQCVEAILRTPLGSYELEPELGIPDQTFRTDMTGVERAIDTYESRAGYALTMEERDDLVERIAVNIDLKGATE